jgi:hypothetical protein
MGIYECPLPFPAGTVADQQTPEHPGSIMEESMSKLSIADLKNTTLVLPESLHTRASAVAVKAIEVFIHSWSSEIKNAGSLPLEIAGDLFDVWTIGQLTLLEPSFKLKELLEKKKLEWENVQTLLLKWISEQEFAKVVVLAGTSKHNHAHAGIHHAATGSFKVLDVPIAQLVDTTEYPLFQQIPLQDKLLIVSHARADCRMQAMQLAEATFKELVTSGLQNLPDDLECPPVWIEDDALDPELQRELYQ